MLKILLLKTENMIFLSLSPSFFLVYLQFDIYKYKPNNKKREKEKNLLNI